MQKISLFFFLQLYFCVILCGMNRDSVLYSRIDLALHKAIMWLVEDEENFKPETFIIYNYLERKFNAPPLYNHQEYMISMQMNERRFNAIYPFLRLIDSSATLTKERMAAINNPMNKTLAQAIWSDKFGLPTNYFETLKHDISIGGYKMTHVYFGLQFLLEHNSPICKTKEFLDLEKEALNALKNHIKEHPYPGDITIECLVFLAYTDKGEGYITSDLIEKILDLQLESGAWHYDEYRHVEEQHTVILAMWLLYEYRYPNALAINWLRLH
ncbi:MAG: hypothetical protein MK207_12140 [Saprospiraceae bacterium]|nr:hypothetical protein [Saprospiraceae bacterium]